MMATLRIKGSSLWIALVISYILFDLAASAADDNVATYTSEESRLREDLFRDYHPFVRPAKNATTPVKVEVMLWFNHILEIDARGWLMTFSAWVNVMWEDSRLSWNDTDYSGIKSLAVNALQGVWIPDFAIYTSTSANPRRMSHGGHVLVKNTGQIRQYYVVNIDTHCTMDITNFPFDTHHCQIYGGAYHHKGDMVAITLPARPIGRYVNKMHDVWTVINQTAANITDPYWPYLNFTISVQRQAAFALHMYVAPPVVISMVTPFAFLLKSTGAQRSILSISVIVNMCYLINNFDWLVPNAQGGMPKLGIFYVASLAIAVIAFMMSACVAVMADWASGKTAPHHIITMVIGDWLAMALMVTRIPHGGVTVDGGSSGGDMQVTDEKDQSSEWLHLARVLDRAFFVIFSVTLAILMMACLL